MSILRQLWSWKSALVCLLAWTAFSSLEAQEWTRFRGPNGSGESEADGIPVTWGEKDLLWKVKLPGAGHSSPVVWDNRVYVTSTDDDASKSVSCFDVADGSDLWKRSFPGKVYPKNTLNGFADATPALDKDHLYLAWTTPEEYTIVALDQQTGKDAWRRNLGPFTAQHGSGASPIVFEDMLIVPNDQDGASSLIALDCATGKTRWTAPRRSTKAAYSTPIIYSGQDGSAELILTSNAHGISSFDPHTGKLNWELPVMEYRTVGSPIVAGGLIFAACGEGGGGKQMFAVQPPDAAQEAGRQGGLQRRRQAALRGHAGGLREADFPLERSGHRLLPGCRDGQEALAAAGGRQVLRIADSHPGPVVRISREGQVVVIAAADKFKLLGADQVGRTQPEHARGIRWGAACCARSRNCWRSEGNKTRKAVSPDREVHTRRT